MINALLKKNFVYFKNNRLIISLLGSVKKLV